MTIGEDGYILVLLSQDFTFLIWRYKVCKDLFTEEV